MTRRRGTVVALVGAGVLAGLLMTAQRAWAAGTPKPLQPSLIDQGEQLYLTGCSSCHGVGGAGTSQAPTLIGVGAASANFFLTTGRMPAASPGGTQAVRKEPAYSPAEIEALVAYVASLGPGPAIPEVDASNASVSAGGVLFRANCAPCHQSAGSGGALSYGQNAPDLHQATAVQVVEAMRIGPGQMPVFDERTISDDEARDIAAYVLYLQKPDNRGGLPLGGFGPVTEGFVALLVGLGGLVAVSVWIVGRKRRHA